MKKLVAITAATAALLAAATAPAHAEEPGTIVDIAVAASGGGAPDDNSADYDLLVQAVLYTGLEGVLGDPAAELTVFAPTDAAFLALVTDLTGTAPASEADALATIVGALSVGQIANVLTYHVTGGALSRVDVLRSGSLDMENGGVVEPRGVNLRDENDAFKNPRFVKGATDIVASNGVIHSINRVLVPAVL